MACFVMHPSLAPGKRSCAPIEDMAMIQPCVFSKAGTAALQAILNEDLSNQNLLVFKKSLGYLTKLKIPRILTSNVFHHALGSFLFSS